MELTPQNFAITHPTPNELLVKDIANVQGQVDRHNGDVVYSFHLQTLPLVSIGYPLDYAIHLTLLNFNIADLAKVEFRPDGTPTGAMISAGRYAPPGYAPVPKPVGN